MKFSEMPYVRPDLAAFQAKAEEIAQKGGIDRRHTRLDAEGEAFCRWATALYQKEGDKPEPWNICELRRRFLAEATGNKDRYS